MSELGNFGGWAIQRSCYDFIRSILPDKSTILELGSGVGTHHLSQHYTMYSIENYTDWLDKYESTYIYAPIKMYDMQWTAPDLPGENSQFQRGWYDPSLLEGKLPKKYDLILVDGPNGSFGRGGFLKHLDMFDTSVPMIFDDINREDERMLMIKVSEAINRPWKEVDRFTGYIL